MKIKKYLIIPVLSMILMTGCGNKAFDKAMDEGKLAIASKEYEKAEGMFSLAIEEKKGDKEANALYNQIQKLIEAMKLKEEGKLEEAIALCDDIDKIESESEFIKKEANILAVETSLVEAETLINNGKYSDAKNKIVKLLDIIENNDNLISQIEKANILIETCDSKIEEEKKKQEAIKAKSTALNAYYNFLKSYEFTSDYSTCGFNLAYINNDSIPELIVFDGDYHAVGGKVYAYVNGEVIYVNEFGEWGGFEYQENNGVICSSWSGMGNSYSTYYKWDGSKLSTIISSSSIEEMSSNGDFGYRYYINDKEVTLSEYNSSIAPYENGFKYVSVDDSYAVTDSVMKDKLLN